MVVKPTERAKKILRKMNDEEIKASGKNLEEKTGISIDKLLK